MRKLVLIVATGAGSGYSPVAPGTAGSLVGLLLYAALARGPALGVAGAAALVTGVGIWAAGRAEELLGRHDDGRIVIDEVAGMLASVAFLPVRLDVALVGFVLFRVFDIAKPPPARRFERLPGGFGVVLDDLAAAAYANAAGQLLWRGALPGGLW